MTERVSAHMVDREKERQTGECLNVCMCASFCYECHSIYETIQNGKEK